MILASSERNCHLILPAFRLLTGAAGTVEAKKFLHLYRNQTLEEERADELLAKLKKIAAAKNEGTRIGDSVCACTACELELNAHTVREWFVAWKEETFRTMLSKAFREHVVKLRRSGASLAKVKARTGVSTATCRRWMAVSDDGA